MSDTKNLTALIITLFICVLDGYSMMNYRLSAKKSYTWFGIVTLFCLAINSYICLKYGETVLRNVILFTIGIPYFVLVLCITKDNIPQTVFNFWLWINVYDIISSFSIFIDDITFKNYYFLTFFRFFLFCGYFVLYNRHLKVKHKMIMEKLDVNWWAFTFIPMLFILLLCAVNFTFSPIFGYKRNYLVLFVIHILMLFVYILMFYTFKTVSDSMERDKLSQRLKEQIALQKKQYEFYIEKEEAQRIFRHDARHRDMLILNCLDDGNINSAKEILNNELKEMHLNKTITFCKNTLINAVLVNYLNLAQKKDIKFSANIQMPEKLVCDEALFCVMLSNLLENSLDAAKSYISVKTTQHNSQLCVNIKNDYETVPKKDENGNYISEKHGGEGLGIKSSGAILKRNGGFLKISDKDGEFNVIATFKNV